MYAAWKTDPLFFLEEYRRRCGILGKTVEVYFSEGAQTAVAEDITEDFGLTVRLENGEKKTLHMGEVSIVSL